MIPVTSVIEVKFMSSKFWHENWQYKHFQWFWKNLGKHEKQTFWPISTAVNDPADYVILILIFITCDIHIWEQIKEVTE